MRLSELFEDNEVDMAKFNDAWISVVGSYQDMYSGPEVSRILSTAKTMYQDPGKNIDAQDAISQAADIVKYDRLAKQAKKDKFDQRKKANQPKQTRAKPARDKVKPSITVPDADRTRKDAMGRNLKADRYYQELNKSQRGRNIIKKVSQKLGLPPNADEVIDHIADTMPTVIQKLDNLIANPADIGGALNPRNRRK